MRVASYRRISTDEERQPFSLDAQQERLASYVAAQPGWVLSRSYSDHMSGKRLDRPGLQQALHDAGPAATTCCWCSRSTGWPGPPVG
jgi:site-specific DNA recombinase